MEQLKTRSATEVDDELIVEVDRDETKKRTMKTRWMLVGVAAVAIAVVVVIVVLTRDSGDPGDSRLATDATPLTEEFAPVEAATYRVDTLGTPFTLTIDQSLFVYPNARGRFVLGDPGSLGPDDRDIVMIRLSALSDPAEPTRWYADFGDGWPAGDFDGWLENLSDEVVVSNREDTTLGGLDATRVDLEIGESDCRPGGFCMIFGTNHQITGKELSVGSMYRIWVVDQADEAPLAVIVGINREADSGWFDTAEGILSTLAFGRVAPNPVLAAPAGPIELPFLGGIRTELANTGVVVQDVVAHGRIFLEGPPGDTEFLTNPLDSNGNALSTIDEALAAMQETGAEATEIESTTVDGIEARVFEIAGRSPQPVLKMDPDDERGWRPPNRGRMWMLDHPERGLLMITAEAFDDVDEVFPLVLAQTEAIVGSLEFIDLG